jgi:hypothetical protein
MMAHEDHVDGLVGHLVGAGLNDVGEEHRVNRIQRSVRLRSSADGNE